jgi:hypothetical protein
MSLQSLYKRLQTSVVPGVLGAAGTPFSVRVKGTGGTRHPVSNVVTGGTPDVTHEGIGGVYSDFTYAERNSSALRGDDSQALVRDTDTRVFLEAAPPLTATTFVPTTRVQDERSGEWFSVVRADPVRPGGVTVGWLVHLRR